MIDLTWRFLTSATHFPKMLPFVLRRVVSTSSFRSTGVLLASLARKPLVPPVRALALSPVNYNFPDMEKMMNQVSKNPKAMALLQAIQKDPKILQAVQDLMMTLNRKGYIDLKNPTKQPSLTMLGDSEIRAKLFELMRLLSAAGVFNTKSGANPLESFSNIMGLLMPPSSSKNQKDDRPDGSKPKYDFTYDATAKDKSSRPADDPMQGWADKLKKMFK